MKAFSPGTAIDDGDGIIVCTSCSILANNASGNKTFDVKACVCLARLHSRSRIIIIPNRKEDFIVISADRSLSLIESTVNVATKASVSLYTGIRNGDGVAVGLSCFTRAAVGLPFFTLAGSKDRAVNKTAVNISLDGTPRNGYLILQSASSSLIQSACDITCDMTHSIKNNAVFPEHSPPFFSVAGTHDVSLD